MSKPKRIRSKLCPLCNLPIEGGTIVMYKSGHWAHKTCRDDDRAKRKAEEAARKRLVLAKPKLLRLEEEINRAKKAQAAKSAQGVRTSLRQVSNHND